MQNRKVKSHFQSYYNGQSATPLGDIQKNINSDNNITRLTSNVAEIHKIFFKAHRTLHKIE